MMNFKSALTAFLFFALSGNAQSFKWQAKLEQVPASGFYNIALTPDIITKTENTDLSDIRIFQKDKEIAYLLRKEPDSLATVLIPAPTLKVREIKASKQSIVAINFDKAFQIDKLALTVAGFKFYRRQAWLAEPNPNYRNKRNQNEYVRLIDFIISSGKPTIIDLYGEKRYKQLYLFIENEDNIPLRINKVDAYQRNIHLTTYLEKNKTYTVKSGQLNMNVPNYDLSYFNDSISNAVPFIKVGNFSRSTQEVTVTKIPFIGKTWMWIALSMLITFIAYLSFKMIKEMQRKN